MGWGYTGEVQCVFCRSIIESRGHFFFFECGYSRGLWRELMSRCLVPDPPIYSVDTSDVYGLKRVEKQKFKGC